MTELKTLKDLDKFSFNPHAKESNDEWEHQEDMIRIDELKQEAIKWVKKSRNEFKGRESVGNWIMMFFNLTEEELK